MDYDFNLIEIDKSDDGGFSVFATDFIKKYWGAGALGEVVRAAKDPRIVPLMKEAFFKEGVMTLREGWGQVLVEILTARTKKVPYNYDLIKVEEVDGHAVVETDAFLDAYAQAGDLRIPSDVQMRIEALVREPFSPDIERKIKKFLGDAFVSALLAPGAKYAIHSIVRARHNRMERAQAPQRARFKQHVLPDQRRLIRNRPVLITETELKDHLESLWTQHQANLLEVRTEDGRLLDLEALVKHRRAAQKVDPTFAPEDAIMAAPPVPLAPHPILDSVANDRPTGIPFPKYAGDKVLNKDQVQQVVTGMASIDGELKIDPKNGDVIVVPEGAADVPPPVEEPDLPHDPTEQEAVDEEHLEEVAVDEEEEVEDLPPGIPPPPPPPGGMPRTNPKKKHRR